MRGKTRERDRGGVKWRGRATAEGFNVPYPVLPSSPEEEEDLEHETEEEQEEKKEASRKRKRV